MISLQNISSTVGDCDNRKPRLGFLGVGWIGRNRLEAIAQAGIAEIVAIADAADGVKIEAAEIAPTAVFLDSMEGLLNQEIDGIVIATPSALHGEQSIAALKRGISVFCQKPLARNSCETKATIECARHYNKLLGVDLSYRFINGVPELRGIIQRGELGHIYAADMVFHNAYGPDKSWFYDRRLSGGGCVIDLGIHLVDLALWVLGSSRVEAVSSRSFAQGERLGSRRATQCVEDFAIAQMEVNSTTVNLACSWKAHVGCDAVIKASFFGTRGGIELRNVDGSFYQFVLERFTGTKREIVAASVDSWGGRAVVEWARRLGAGVRYDPSVEGLIKVAETLDRIYEA